MPEKTNARTWNKTTAMRLRARVSMELAGSDLILHAGGQVARVPREFLDLIAFYRDSHTVAEGFEFLGRLAKNPHDLAQAFARMMQLCELGILEPEEGSDRPSPGEHDTRFGPPTQIRMLGDRARTSAFLQAIRRTVRPGDVVVDLGTGSGVLAVAAARAGAKRVYAIEAQPIATAAERFFKGSGFDDRITLIRGNSMEITLDEKADVLVSEIIGDQPLGERILATTRDAVARLLKPGAHVIPASLRLYATPVVVPEMLRRRVFFTPEILDRWQRWYSLPFGTLLDPPNSVADRIGLVGTLVNPWTARRWMTLSAPTLLQNYDLASVSVPSTASETTLSLQRKGDLGGFLIHFEADLSQGIRISTEPRLVAKSNHWAVPLWLLPSVLEVEPGKQILARAELGTNPTFEILTNSRALT